ncbi:sigma-70 family RNA polymerase sigma factor [Kitasatospora herbaricolor]|uniref:Sigma-70 family RNA polymerase sigma factor n=1 Tax=Kitasatospora herbaricolor TaxID=68217 RepID=A0ABZ1WI84_9ACTN|nr:sigma-70 family RNA polymerase sigma factor [Kitasatospora herbaricolor]
MQQHPHPAEDAPEFAPHPDTDDVSGSYPSGCDAEPDSVLIARLRAGDDTVVETLFERHHRAALGYARSLGGMEHRVEDLASEAFVRTLAAVRAGSGPTTYWRPYLLTVVRNTAAAWATSDRRSFPSDDLQGWADEAGHALSPDQIVAASAEHDLIVTAYRSLPERWRTVLWHTVVQRRPADEVGPLLGLSASGVSSLAARAREGLRTAYLAAHLHRAQSAQCQAYAGRLTALVRGPSQRMPKALARHLDECPDCRRCDEELRDVNRRLRLAAVALVGPWHGGGTGWTPAPLAEHLSALPPHGPAPSAPRAGTGKVVAGAVTAGVAAVVAAMVLVPSHTSPPPERPVGSRPALLLSTPTEGASESPAGAVPVLPATSLAASPATSLAASSAASGRAAGVAGPATATPASPTTRPGASPATSAPSRVGAGGLSASVLSGSTPVAALPGDRKVRLLLGGTGNCAGVEDEDTESTAGLPYFTPCAGSGDQQWIVRADRSGGVRLLNAANGGCLESAGTVGAVVSQTACGENSRQSWQVVDLTNGESSLRHRASGLLLASQGTGQVDDTLQLRAAGCTADPVCRPSAAFRL